MKVRIQTALKCGIYRYRRLCHSKIRLRLEVWCFGNMDLRETEEKYGDAAVAGQLQQGWDFTWGALMVGKRFCDSQTICSEAMYLDPPSLLCILAPLIFTPDLRLQRLEGKYKFRHPGWWTQGVTDPFRPVGDLHTGAEHPTAHCDFLHQLLPLSLPTQPELVGNLLQAIIVTGTFRKVIALDPLWNLWGRYCHPYFTEVH